MSSKNRDLLIDSDTDSQSSTDTITPSSSPRESSHTQTYPPTAISSSSLSKMSTPITQKDFAVKLLHGLGKTPITDRLTDSTYFGWDLAIKRTLRSHTLHNYLTSNEEPTGCTSVEHLANQECITNWLLNSMDSLNASGFQSKILTVENGDADIDYNPSRLWKLIQEYHAPRTETEKFNLDREIRNVKQGGNINLLTHLENF